MSNPELACVYCQQVKIACGGIGCICRFCQSCWKRYVPAQPESYLVVHICPDCKKRKEGT